MLNILIGLFGFIGLLLIVASVGSMFGVTSLKKFRFAWVFGLVSLLVTQSLFYAAPGHLYYVLNPFGQESAITQPGVKFVVPFSKIQEWEKYIDVKTLVEGQSAEGVEGVINGPIGVRFIDQVSADVQISTRFEIPEDPVSFINLVQTFRHPKNLANNTLIPTIKEQVYNVSQMFRAEAYVTGDAQDFRATLDDALKNGTFVVDRTEARDTLYEEMDVTKGIVGKNRKIKGIQPRIVVEKRLDKNGVPMREDHDITKNNVLIAQVIVEAVTMEAKFKQKLEEQRDISAQKSIEAQKIETARIAQERILAEGERDKAAERVAQEKDQVKKLIAIETQVKEEESKRQLAEIALQTERLLSTKRKVAADAKKYEIIQADEISAEEKYRLDRQTEQIKYLSAALENTKWPSSYFNAGGGNGKNGGDPLTNLTSIMTMQMAEGMKKSKSGGN